MTQTHRIKLKVLTPVHIGNGRSLSGNFDYTYFKDQRKLAVFDLDKLLAIIGVENINKWTTVIEQKGNLLQELPMLRGKRPEDLAQRIINIAKVAPDSSKNEIKEQLFLGNGLACIPGSSLKGSFRTAFLTKLIKENPYFVKKEANLKGWKDRFSDAKLMAEYMGREKSRHSPNKDLFRFVRIGDFSFDTDTILVKAKVISLFQLGRDDYRWGEKKRESSFWECIPAGASTSGVIQIPEDLITRVEEKGYVSSKKLQNIGLEQLFKIANAHTLHLLRREIDLWEDEGNPEAIGDLLKELQSLEKLIKNIDEKSCILRVGAGSGWEFMTGAWPADKDLHGKYILDDDLWIKLKSTLRRKNYPEDLLFPKSRKIVDQGLPLGFVKLSVM